MADDERGFASPVFGDAVSQVGQVALNAQAAVFTPALKYFYGREVVAEFAGDRLHVAGCAGAAVQDEDDGAAAPVRACFRQG
jgi:hypothetical protein